MPKIVEPQTKQRALRLTSSGVDMTENDGQKTTSTTSPKWVWVISIIMALIGIIPALLGAATAKTSPSTITVVGSPDARINSDDVTVNNDYSQTINNYGPARRFVDNWYSGARKIIGSPIEAPPTAASVDGTNRLETQITDLKKQVAQLSSDLKAAQEQLTLEHKKRPDIDTEERRKLLAQTRPDASPPHTAVVEEQDAPNSSANKSAPLDLFPEFSRQLWLTTGQLLRRPNSKLIEVVGVSGSFIELRSDNFTRQLRVADEVAFNNNGGVTANSLEGSTSDGCVFQLERIDQPGRALVQVVCSKKFRQ